MDLIETSQWDLSFKKSLVSSENVSDVWLGRRGGGWDEGRERTSTTSTLVRDQLKERKKREIRLY